MDRLLREADCEWTPDFSRVTIYAETRLTFSQRVIGMNSNKAQDPAGDFECYRDVSTVVLSHHGIAVTERSVRGRKRPACTCRMSTTKPEESFTQLALLS